MTETRTRVVAVRVDMDCDRCGAGQMRPTGTALMSNPPIYVHQCNNPKCRHEARFRTSYPHIDYIPEDQA